MGSTTVLTTSSQVRTSPEDTPRPPPEVRGQEVVELESLVATHQEQIGRVVARLLDRGDDVADVVQDVFVSALENLKRFRGQCELSTWLTAIAVNKCRSHRRRVQLRRYVFGWLVRNTDAPAAAACPVETSEAHEQLHGAIARLPSKYREPIVLRYFEEYGMDEIARVLGLTRNTVEVRLSRARSKLKGMLDCPSADKSP